MTKTRKEILHENLMEFKSASKGLSLENQLKLVLKGAELAMQEFSEQEFSKVKYENKTLLQELQNQLGDNDAELKQKDLRIKELEWALSELLKSYKMYVKNPEKSEYVINAEKSLIQQSKQQTS